MTSTPHIVVIDDDAMVRTAVTRILESEGFQVALAGDGREGLRLMRSLQPRLVITDIIMPEMEGIETIREMRRERSDLKIMAISGGARMGNANFLDMARTMGADAIMEKPFEPEDLVAKVRQLLGE
jgi:DNA-binding response OmpR family regulator